MTQKDSGGVSRKKKTRQRAIKREIGPIIELRNKALFPYAPGAGTTYFQVTLPEEFTSLNGIKPGNSALMYYSLSCKGFLLLKPDLPLPQSFQIDFQTVKKSLKLENKSFPVVLESFLREEILARIEQGYEKIAMKFNSWEDSENAGRFVSRILEPAGQMVQIGTSIPEGGNSDEFVIYEEILVKDDPKGIEEFRKNSIEVFDFGGLTSYMIREVRKFLEDSIRLLQNAIEKSQKSELRALGIREARIDFLWAYLCRQLIRANRYGLFSGSGRYTSITPVALGGFYKLLEHATDQMMGINRAVCEGLEMGRDEKTNRFVGELIAVLKKNARQFEQIEGPLLSSIENRLGEENRGKISEALRTYHEETRKLTGGSSEYYVGEVGLLGDIGAGLRGMEPNKMLMLAQSIYPLQKLCKFPANIAMLARILDFGSQL